MTEPTTESASCLSDLTLDGWIGDELEAERRASVAAHLESCAKCQQRLATIEAETRAFLAQAPTFADQARITEELRAARAVTTRSRRMAIASSVIGLAAMVTLAVVSRDAPPGVRTKGDGAQVTFFVKRDGQVMEGVRGQAVHAGDQLRFAYSSTQDVHAMLIDVDVHGPTVYLPNAGQQSVLLPAAQDRALDFGVELDQALGREHVYAIFCPHAFSVEAALTALSGPQPAPPKDCTLDVIELHKELR